MPPPRWRPFTQRVALVLAVLLHAAVILLFLLFARERQPQEDDSQQGVSVVFDNGGQTQATAPPAPHEGPTSIAQAPPPASPPPPPQPQTTQAPPQVNLNLPPMPFADVQSAPMPQIPPPPQPQPQQQPAQRPVPHPQPVQKYTVMNGMSFGNPSNPSPPMPQAPQGLNLSMPESDMQAAIGPEVTVKGDAGADWDAALNKWVNDHKYYPQAALEQNQQGDVKIEFTVDRAGNVTGLHMLSGSGSPFLDQAWLGLFAQNQLPPFPPGAKSDHVMVDATMHFEIIQ